MPCFSVASIRYKLSSASRAGTEPLVITTLLRLLEITTDPRNSRNVKRVFESNFRKRHRGVWTATRVKRTRSRHRAECDSAVTYGRVVFLCRRTIKTRARPHTCTMYSVYTLRRHTRVFEWQKRAATNSYVYTRTRSTMGARCMWYPRARDERTSGRCLTTFTVLKRFRVPGSRAFAQKGLLFPSDHDDETKTVFTTNHSSARPTVGWRA